MEQGRAVEITARDPAASRLLQALDWLLEEVAGEAPGADGPRDAPAALAEPFPGVEGADEQLIAALRAGLLALARPALRRRPAGEDALRGALDGVDIVVRGELLAGRAADLPTRLPGFVFLVLVPLLGRAEALRLADRSASLLLTRL